MIEYSFSEGWAAIGPLVEGDGYQRACPFCGADKPPCNVFKKGGVLTLNGECHDCGVAFKVSASVEGTPFEEDGDE